MAKQTDTALRGQLMYSVFVRNHTKEGTFRALEADLDRIAGLGTDIIWLMPIHPIGAQARKGELGSPYAIRDYRDINPEYGTLGDFIHLVEEIHRRGMKCIIDVVYNHTSPDSVLAQTHPEFFLRDENGQPTRHVAEWWDIVDLDYSNRDLWKYQTETLKMWAEIVDGFRCDVASMVPVEFWNQARRQVESVRPGCIWLAESVFSDHVHAMRCMDAYCASDCDLYEAFDITYDYDIWPAYEGYLKGQCSLQEYVRLLNFQELGYPENYVKLRCLENHDQPRVAGYMKSDLQLRNWLAFSYFQRGVTMLYGGTEYAPVKAVSLFDKDDNFGDMRHDWQLYLCDLREMKRQLPLSGGYRLSCAENEIVLGSYNLPCEKIRGIFCLQGKGGKVSVDLPDGVYRDRIDGREITVCSGAVVTDGMPIVIG